MIKIVFCFIDPPEHYYTQARLKAEPFSSPLRGKGKILVKVRSMHLCKIIAQVGFFTYPYA